MKSGISANEGTFCKTSKTGKNASANGLQPTRSASETPIASAMPYASARRYVVWRTASMSATHPTEPK